MHLVEIGDRHSYFLPDFTSFYIGFWSRQGTLQQPYWFNNTYVEEITALCYLSCFSRDVDTLWTSSLDLQAVSSITCQTPPTWDSKQTEITENYFKLFDTMQILYIILTKISHVSLSVLANGRCH